MIPFVSAVVAVDTPFLGVSNGKADAYGFSEGACEPAMSELTGRRASSDYWATWNAQGVNYLLGQGARVRAIGNRSDCGYNLIVCHTFWGGSSSDDSYAQGLVSGPVQHLYKRRSPGD